MSNLATMPRVSGRLTPNAPLAPLVWFKSGGAAEWLFEPRDETISCSSSRSLIPKFTVMALGLGSNLIVRDGGVPGSSSGSGRPSRGSKRWTSVTLSCGGGASGILVSSTARDAAHRGS